MILTRKEQEFQKTDWYGYSGAVEKEGHKPLIASFTDGGDITLDLLLSYCDTDEKDDSCNVDLNVFIGDDDNYYYSCVCCNWDVAYELFETVYKDLSNRSYRDVIDSLKNKGFELI